MATLKGRPTPTRPTRPSWPTRPTRPSEAELEAELELALFVSRRVAELVRIARDHARRVAERVDDGRRRDARHLFRVEQILQLRDHFGAYRAADRHEARV